MVGDVLFQTFFANYYRPMKQTKKCFLLYLIAFADVLSSQRDGLYGMVVEYENFRIVGSIVQ